MSKKLDKLKEVNSTLKELLIKLETHIFVENISIDNSRKISVHNPEHLVGLK
jgi:hypothetical protein